MGKLCIENPLCENLLRVNFDYRLILKKYIADICQKASRKRNTLLTLVPYMRVSKRHALMNACFKSQFNHYPLIWMWCIQVFKKQSRSITWRMPSKNIYKTLSFSELLEKDCTVSIYQQNIQQLTIKCLQFPRV